MADTKAREDVLELIVDGVRYDITDGVVVRCHCGRMFTAGFVSGTPVIAHQEPRCVEFEQLEPDEFMRWVRLKYEGQLDS